MVHETGSKLIKLTCFIQLIKCKGYQRPELVSSIMYIVSCRHEADLRIVLRNMWTLYTLQHTHQNIHAKHAIIERKKNSRPKPFCWHEKWTKLSLTILNGMQQQLTIHNKENNIKNNNNFPHSVAELHL